MQVVSLFGVEDKLSFVGEEWKSGVVNSRAQNPVSKTSQHIQYLESNRK